MSDEDLSARVVALEEELAELKAQLEAVVRHLSQEPTLNTDYEDVQAEASRQRRPWGR